MKVVDRTARAAVAQAEMGRIPDWMLRAGIRLVVAARLAKEKRTSPVDRNRFWKDAWEGRIALATDDANEQHYEVPPQFFDVVLGKRRKYSSALWSEDTVSLDLAEDKMLALYESRGELEDGQSILDLGCGWGSFSLWAAERYPNSRIVAVSNSTQQREHIVAAARRSGLTNLEVITEDVNRFTPHHRFDRIVSIEMLEHVRNHRALFRRMRSWIYDDGALFVHVFGHRRYAYPFEIEGPGTWMARTFFTGGVMPSPSLLPDAAVPHFTTDATWWMNGDHYSRTLEAWLERMDSHQEEVRTILEPTYGDDVDHWIQRWRMFFMACSEMFAFDGGEEWGVIHHLLRPTSN